MSFLNLIDPVLLAGLSVIIFFLSLGRRAKNSVAPVSVNFHFTRRCNYSCGFCFHTAKTSYMTPVKIAKEGLQKLRDCGMRKLNLSGGEPFLEAHYVGEICQFSKEVLKLESVSIVSNGSKIRESFFKKYGRFVDILAISVDSFDQETNIKIGRDEKGKGEHLVHLAQVAEWCQEYDIKFKLNTVVNKYNWQDDMNDQITQLAPFRWKVFQVLKVDTENSGSGKRDVTPFLISDEEFAAFLERHKEQPALIPETNELMKSSYLILDEYMRFLNKGDTYGTSQSILQVSIEEALREVDFESDVFYKRGGIYQWENKKIMSACGSRSSCDEGLLW